jgi:hypothetical protein
MLYAEPGSRALSGEGRVLVCSQVPLKEIPNLHVHPALMILFDLILALGPIKLIRTISRPLRKKLLISILMATGLLATAIACVKLTT